MSDAHDSPLPGLRYLEPEHWPAVSVIVPVSNAGAKLRDRVSRLLAQEYGGELEIVIAVLPSRDDTEAVASALEAENDSVAVIRVPREETAAALTSAVYAASHSIIVRAGQRGVLPSNYVHRAVADLLATGAACVGGVQHPVGDGPFREAEARAMTSRLGVGGARFHVGGEAGATRSVYLGAYRRSVIERLGGFDYRFGVAYDWELNYRIRRVGGLIWFDPDLEVGFETHGTLVGLGHAFFRSGWARRTIVRAYPETLSLRYLASPVTIATVVAGIIVAGLMALAGWAPYAWVGLLPLAIYALTLLIGSLAVGRGLSCRAKAWLPVVLACMHGSWAAGYLANVRRLPARA